MSEPSQAHETVSERRTVSARAVQWIARFFVMSAGALYVVVVAGWFAAMIDNRAVSYSTRSHDAALYIEHDVFVFAWNSFPDRRIPGWDFVPGWNRNEFAYYNGWGHFKRYAWPVFYYFRSNGEMTQRLDLPCWTPTLLLAIYLFDFPYEFRNARTNRRARLGHCLNCGYDLRASREKCPECGKVPVPHTPPIALFRKHFMHRALLVTFLGTLGIVLGARSGLPTPTYYNMVYAAKAMPADSPGAVVSWLGSNWSFHSEQTSGAHPDGRPPGSGRSYTFQGPPFKSINGFNPTTYVTTLDECTIWIMPASYVDEPADQTMAIAQLIAITPDSKIFFAERDWSSYLRRVRIILRALFPDAR